MMSEFRREGGVPEIRTLLNKGNYSVVPNKQVGWNKGVG